MIHPDRSEHGKNDAPAITRREALGQIAGFSAAAAFTTDAPATPRSKAVKSPPHIVDVHHHCMPPFWMDHAMPWMAGTTATAERVRGWTPQRSLEVLDAAGVDMAILSIPPPGFAFNLVSIAPLARRCNDYAAKLAHEHGTRFRFYTALPMPDVKATIAEVAHAYEQLGTSGVGLLTNYDGRYLGDPLFEPLFDALNQYHAIVHVHPTDVQRCRDLNPGISTPVLEFAADTGRTIMSLLWSGVLSRYPNVRFIFSHGGGIAPAIYSRIVGIGSYKPDLAAKVPEGPEAALAKLYVDTASLHHRQDFFTGCAWMQPGHVLHGSDYPWTTPEITVNTVRKFTTDETLSSRILGRNALDLFGGIFSPAS